MMLWLMLIKIILWRELLYFIVWVVLEQFKFCRLKEHALEDSVFVLHDHDFFIFILLMHCGISRWDVMLVQCFFILIVFFFFNLCFYVLSSVFAVCFFIFISRLKFIVGILDLIHVEDFFIVSIWSITSFLLHEEFELCLHENFTKSFNHVHSLSSRDLVICNQILNVLVDEQTIKWVLDITEHIIYGAKDKFICIEYNVIQVHDELWICVLCIIVCRDDDLAVNDA